MIELPEEVPEGRDETEGEPNEVVESEEPKDQLPSATPEEVMTTAEEFLRGLLAAMELEAEVQSRADGRRVNIEIAGSELGLLIGRRGQTLDALQELVRTAVQRRLRARVRLLVDVEGYRSRRKASLEEYARAMALRAKERGTEIELEPMNSYERKIVHDAVTDVEGATSFSEGEEPERKVIVRGE
ncbi:MAG: KH domain-containing protein [Actinomycetota bacterium]|nr:KH domain-containing protein [Actinomycetota bacterium]